MNDIEKNDIILENIDKLHHIRLERFLCEFGSKYSPKSPLCDVSPYMDKCQSIGTACNIIKKVNYDPYNVEIEKYVDFIKLFSKHFLYNEE